MVRRTVYGNRVVSKFAKYSKPKENEKIPKHAKPAPERLYVPRRLKRMHAERINSVLHDKAKYCDLNGIRSSIRQGAHVNSIISGISPLLRALSHGAFDLEGAVEYLLKKGANPNVSTESGWSPLIAATFANSIYHVKLLLKYGADPEHRDSFGGTALSLAVKRGNYEVAQLLIKYAGRSPPLTEGYALQREVDEVMSKRMLHAVRNEDTVKIESLLELGVDINIGNQDGITALMSAAMDCQNNMIIFLLEKGADPDVQDRTGVTALDWADAYGHGIVYSHILSEMEKDMNSGTIERKAQKAEIMRMFRELAREAQSLRAWEEGRDEHMALKKK